MTYDMKNSMKRYDKERSCSAIASLRLVVMMFLMVGIGEMWGQETGYSGTYYIASDAKHIYNANTPANNYYLCPTEGWCYYQDPNNFWPSNTEDGNKTMPFLTTYKCKTNGYHSGNSSDAIWAIEKAPAPNDAYYYIRQASTGRYLTSNGQVEIAGIDRIRVHLESFNNPNGAGNKILFDIGPNSNGDLVISPQAIQETGTHNNSDHSTHRWLVVNGGNKNALTGQSGKEGGPTGYANTAGIIGIYTQTDDNAPFVLEKALSIDPPTITNNFDGTFTITAAAGATIYYTTNGDRPTTSTTTTGTTSVVVNQTAEMTVIKALAKATSDPFPTVVTTYNIPVCEKPVITISGTTVTITCATDAAAIHYTTDGNPATANSTTYAGPFAKGDASIIRAVATKTGYAISSEAILEPPKEVSSSSEITDMAGNYILASDFTLTASIGSESDPFTGTIDGNMITLSGFRRPLVAYANGATIKNVMLKNVHINQSGNVGAIVGEAKGYTRIYNCGILPNDNTFSNRVRHSSVASTDGYCGGLVGWLKDDSRVINCFSFANVNGGTYVAGIVGYNEAGSTTAVTTVEGKDYYSNLRTAVVNCMFYGNITSGTNRWPVYGGAKMTNKGATAINNYDFYRAEANLGLIDNNHYNCSFPAKEEYLTKYEYYRYLLNSNRELCGWWVGAPFAPRTMTTAEVQAVPKDATLMAKWVLDPSIAPYPILKPAGKYPSVINQSPEPATTATAAASAMRIDSSTKQWVDRASSSNTEMVNPKAAPETEGQILGTIKVNISDGSNSKTRYCAITAMDIDNNDFSYGKIQLPYYNSIFGDPNGTTWAAKYGGNYTDNVVVGWTISSPSGDNIPSISNQSGTDENGIPYDHTYSTNSQSGYNFADRYCTTKDENRVFAQGGYYYVPYGVSEITITAKWASAIYLDNGADHSYDRVYMSYHNSNDNNDPNNNKGFHFAPAGSRPTKLGNGKTVLSASIASQISSSGSVYDYAIVLVGNHQYRVGNNNINTTNGRTIISADFDLDDEPDNCLIWQLGQGTNRYHICPIRFDFLPVVEMGLAMKEDNSTQYFSLGCYRPRGHFEVTETSLIHFGQFEFGNQDRTIEAPLILNGGIFDQYCKGTMSKAPNETYGDYINYIILGGNVRMPSFTPGAHVRATSNYATFHCPVSVMGGNIDYLYLTGNFNDKVTPNADNPHCYIDGGNYKQVAAAAKEGIDGNVTFKVNHSIIQEFYGGSTLADKLVTGNIDVTMDNSNVTKYCGGPKFGNMNLNESDPTKNKTVTTTANGTTFGVYYGGGNGGTSYMQYASTDKTVDDATAAYDWDASDLGNLGSYSPRAYYKKANTDPKGIGYKADYEMEIVNSSAGTDAKKAIFRTYFYAAQFSATNTGPITNFLTDCKVLNNFYGGGNLGGVIGDVTSTLTNTEVQGSAFGAGYSASVPEVTIYDKDKTAPTVNVYTGIITPTPDPDPTSHSTTYTWCYKNNTTNEVIPSGVVIPNNVGTNNPAFEYEGKKYFYTEESLENLGTVTGKATLNIEGTTTVAHSVYGGGEESGVDGNTEVTVTGGTIGTEDEGGAEYGNIYGGGKGKANDVTAGLVKGSTNVSISGSPTILHNVYGGGAYGSVGTFSYDATTGLPTSWTTTDNKGKCTVSITGGTIGSTGKENGMVFGSSRGLEGNPETNANVDKMAWVYDTDVTIGTQGSKTGPSIKGSVYGGGENGHNFHDASVTIHSGTIGIPSGEKVTIGDIEYEGARFPNRGNVYGSGCGTDTYKGTDGKTYFGFNAGIVRGNTTVLIDGGHVVHNVYGGGAMGSVGTYTLVDEAYNTAHPEATLPIGKPISCAANTGLCTINISGGQIGMTNATMTGHGNDGPDDFGHVFGAGRGTTADPNLYPNVEKTAYFNNTNVTISNKAFVCGSVYGGSESGHVLNNTNVTISGGQIGCGEGKDKAYTDDEFVSSTSLAGTNHWTYTAGGAGAPYDQYANEQGKYPDNSSSEGGKPVATDGRTFFGNVFAGGSGFYPYAPGKWLKSAGHIGGTASVTVTGGHILNNLYGGCEMADIDGAVTVTMTGGTIGVPRTSAQIKANPNSGNIYGAGMGDKRIFFNTSTNVASATVDISNGTVYGAVYGGGEDGHVMGNVTTTISQPAEKTTVIGCDGQSGYDGNVFGAGQGHVGALTAGVVGGNASLTVTGGTLNGSAYGGGRIASVGTYFAMATIDDPNNPGQKIPNPLYGKMQEGDDHGNLSVNLTGGTIYQNVYGGCMGTTEDINYGISKNVSVELNNGVGNDAQGCIVLGPIFGCNNVNSSPEGTSTVHIYKTQRNGASRINNYGEVKNAKVPGMKDSDGEYDLSSFDVPAVYGGGNLAAYTPKDDNGTTNVIIDGCGLTSIGQVYGGGNAASTPATLVTINGTYEIGELFGGGNGKDAIGKDAQGNDIPNPGANVGFKDYYAVENDERWNTKEKREANQDFIDAYVYGTGLANVTVKGGTIHRVFGGSNTKGNVRETALTMLEEVQESGAPVCEFKVDEAYGGGKSAPMDAEAKLLMACIPGLNEVYGGAEAADIHDDVTLTITNGTFNRVFGGNNISGTISGKITVNVEETGCRPVIIGELYGGGNLAAYSIYGYNDDDTPKESGDNPFDDPVVNVRSFTSIGAVYGGGYGTGAKMIASPTVNVSESVGDPDTYPTTGDDYTTTGFKGKTITVDGHDVVLPAHTKNKIGAIGDVFGGGNAAPVMGDTHVNIGTLVGEGEYVYLVKAFKVGATLPVDCYTKNGNNYEEATGTAQNGITYYRKYPVVGVDIRGNVYGGGNNAEVTGDTHVTIGKEATATP